MTAAAPDAAEAKTWARQHLAGFYMCPLTPFDADYALDEEGLRENLEAFVDMGCDGLVVGGFFAEGWNMTLDEWRRYHEVVAEAVAGRLPLFTILLESSAYQAQEKLRLVEELGYTGAEIMNPSVQLRTDGEICDFLAFVTADTPLAVVLYRTPVSGTVYGHEVVARLAELPNVVGVKNGTVSWNDTLALRRRVGEALVVSEPNERLWVYDRALFGGRVLFGELSLLLYGKRRDDLARYTALAAAGNLAEAIPVAAGLDPVRAVYEEVLISRIVQTGSYVGAMPYLKAWFELVGLRAGPVRPPVRGAITAAERDDLAGRLGAAGVL
ncbi:MAG: dihydrodipicolinate synthase family protein [Actinomycetota bacterium]|jgi:4-hydroxy-tetrahydrodipicolinate synthase